MFLASQSSGVWIVTFIDVLRVSNVVRTRWAVDTIIFLSAIITLLAYWKAAFCSQTGEYFHYILGRGFLIYLDFNLLILSLEHWPVYSFYVERAL